MTLLSSLPSRASADGQINIAGYYLALDGVTRHGLETATKRILQGCLGHTFLPSPPELRQVCDAVMKPIDDVRAYDAERERLLKQQREEQKQTAKTQATWTPESRARATAKWQEIKARIQAENSTEQTNTGGYDTSKEAALTRLQKAAEENGNQFNLDGLKSSATNTFKQVGAAA
ncbi:hypothetical protein ACLBWZ_09000 [Brucellaceae bacterium C25G]